jgi:hypothetical protein
MTPEQLAQKQSEMQERSRRRRSRQNAKNARGPRKQEDLKLRGTRRSIEDLIRDVIAASLPDASPRYMCYLFYMADCRERGEPIKTMKEFYEYLPEEKETDGMPEIQIREPEFNESRSGQPEGQAISLP